MDGAIDCVRWKECDRIYLPDKGNIIESDNYDELMAKEDFFNDLEKKQFV